MRDSEALAADMPEHVAMAAEHMQTGSAKATTVPSYTVPMEYIYTVEHLPQTAPGQVSCILAAG